MPPDPFAAKREEMREEFFAKLFLLGGWLGGTDTYKRTMWSAVPDVALAQACYSLTFRKGLPEPGADNRLIMAGHETMLAQWFHRPLQRSDIALSRVWYREHSNTQAFPDELWDAVLGQPGDDIHLPVDIWGFPGGQTFLAGVPCLAFEARIRCGSVDVAAPQHDGEQFTPQILRCLQHGARLGTGPLRHHGERIAQFFEIDAQRDVQRDALGAVREFGVFQFRSHPPPPGPSHFPSVDCNAARPM